MIYVIACLLRKSNSSRVSHKSNGQTVSFQPLITHIEVSIACGTSIVPAFERAFQAPSFCSSCWIIWHFVFSIQPWHAASSFWNSLSVSSETVAYQLPSSLNHSLTKAVSIDGTCDSIIVATCGAVLLTWHLVKIWKGVASTLHLPTCISLTSTIHDHRYTSFDAEFNPESDAFSFSVSVLVCLKMPSPTHTHTLGVATAFQW